MSSEVKLSSADRVLFPDDGITKGDLFAYYDAVADTIVPHLKDRPVALVRAPSGIEGELFFQKHAERTGMPGLTIHERELWPNHAPLLTVDTVLVGHAGGRELAFFAISTAPQLIMQTVGVGLLLGTVVLTAQADGAGRFEECGRIWRLALLIALGLGLIYSFVELHGGTVTIDSAVGTGTTVTCVFPLGQLAERPAA